MLLRAARAAAGSFSAAAWPAATCASVDGVAGLASISSSCVDAPYEACSSSSQQSGAGPAPCTPSTLPSAPAGAPGACRTHPATSPSCEACHSSRCTCTPRPHQEQQRQRWSGAGRIFGPPSAASAAAPLRMRSGALHPLGACCPRDSSTARRAAQQQQQQHGTAGAPAAAYCSAAASGSDTVEPLNSHILEYSKRKQKGISMKYILDFGAQPLDQQMLLSARFLKEELPVRLAHRIVELDALPIELRRQSQIVKCKGWYSDSFHEIRSFPAIRDQQDVIKFTNMLKSALRRHANVVPAIAKGVELYKRELAKNPLAETASETATIQTFLDTFFMSRIAIRFLVGHHVALHEHATRADHIGLVYTKCSPVHVAADAVADARAICFREYGDAPSVNVVGNPELRFAYVPSHLHHMIFELVKNSLRAVQDRYSKSDDEAPVISVVIAEGVEDITIKVADQGGGIPRSGTQHIWTYLYTTAKSPLPDLDDDDMSNLPAVLAGYGCGLPLSRLYSRYFGGDLQIISMQGYGTDAYLHLNRLGSDEEPLPGKA